MFKSLAKPVLLAAVIVATVFGQQLHLKTRSVSTPAQNAAGLPAVRLLSDVAQTVHQVIEFDHPVGAADLNALMLAGAQVTGVLPDNAVVVSVTGGLTTLPDGAIWVGAMEAQDKISPALAGTSTTQVPVIVEFHSDVDATQQAAQRRGDIELHSLSNAQMAFFWRDGSGHARKA